MSTAQTKTASLGRTAGLGAANKLKDEIDEKIFGAAFNGHIIRRFIGFMRLYSAIIRVADSGVLRDCKRGPNLA